MSSFPIRWIVVAGLAGGLTATVTQAPTVLRQLTVFEVERVEVVGTRYLPPEDALAATGIERGDNVFDDPGPWRDALLAHPLVAGAEVERRLPHTVLVRVREVEPVLLVTTPELRPVDASGRILPIDLSRAPVDLPVLRAASEIAPDGRLRQPDALALIANYDRLRRLDPTLDSLVSEVHAGSDGMRLLLRRPSHADAWLPADAGPLQLLHMQSALTDLRSRGELERLRRVDVRYSGQVVISLEPGPSI